MRTSRKPRKTRSYDKPFLVPFCTLCTSRFALRLACCADGRVSGVLSQPSLKDFLFLLIRRRERYLGVVPPSGETLRGGQDSLSLGEHCKICRLSGRRSPCTGDRPASRMSDSQRHGQKLLEKYNANAAFCDCGKPLKGHRWSSLQEV